MKHKLYTGLCVLLILLIGVGVLLYFTTDTETEPEKVYKPLTSEEKEQVDRSIQEEINKQKTPRVHISDKFEMPAVTADKTTQPAFVPVSPHGFGPYPPLPPSWTETPEEIWGNCVDPDHELLTRVWIKLLSQGVDVLGGFLDPDNGKVYPTIPGIRYAEWEDYEGRRYLSGTSGCPEAGSRLRAIKEAKFNRGEDDSLTEADIPADIQLIPYEEGGIDPYEFLGLTRP